MKDNNSIEDKVNPKFCVVSTKISYDEYKKFCMIAEREGESKYSILQWAISMIIRLKDVGNRITDELLKMCIAFGVESKFVDNYTLCNHTIEPSVQSAIYFLGSSSSKGLHPVFVDRPFLSNAVVSENIIDMFDYFIKHTNPSMYKKMKRESVRRSLGSIYNLQCEWVMVNDGIEDIEEIESMFSDNRRDERGRSMADAPYRRTMVNRSNVEFYMNRKGMESSLNFDDNGA